MIGKLVGAAPAPKEKKPVKDRYVVFSYAVNVLECMDQDMYQDLRRKTDWGVE